MSKYIFFLEISIYKYGSLALPSEICTFCSSKIKNIYYKEAISVFYNLTKTAAIFSLEHFCYTHLFETRSFYS